MIKLILKNLPLNYIPSIICLFLLLKMDYSIWFSVPKNPILDGKIKQALFFAHLIMIFIIIMPLTSRILTRIKNEKLNQFIALPEVGKNITYIDVYDFLSSLALSAFSLSILIFTMENVYETTGWIVSAIYVFLMYLLSMSIAAIASMRFAWLFSKYNKYIYMFVMLIIICICFAIIDVAIQMSS